MKHCLYCDQIIDSFSLSDFIYDDVLCPKCRKQLKPRLRIFRNAGMIVFYFYEYDEFFARVLLQYKEANDEALKSVFVGIYAPLLRWLFRYFDVVYVPSTKAKWENRGFLPMASIMESYGAHEALKVHLKKELIQANKSLKQRKLMQDNYYIKDTSYAKKWIIVIDDVLTSGSSLKAIKNSLNGKYHLIYFVLAIAKKPNA